GPQRGGDFPGQRGPRPFPVGPVPPGRLGGEGGDDRPAARQRVGLGHRVREDHQHPPRQPPSRRLRRQLLVRRQPGRPLPPGRRAARAPDRRGVRLRHAGVAAQRRTPARRLGTGGRRHAGAAGPRHDGDGAARDGPAGALDGVPRFRGLRRALRRAVRHRVGHHEQLRRHRGDAEHEPRRGGARHRGSAVRHRHRPGRRHPGGAGLQQDLHRPVALRRAAGKLRVRIRCHPVAANRGGGRRQSGPFGGTRRGGGV
ncbi:MAG: Tol-Pal system protein TolQ, partial [uncultured Acetobacteraceae bacterium]